MTAEPHDEPSVEISSTAQDEIICGSMVDIQSATAENRRGKKESKKERTRQFDHPI